MVIFRRLGSLNSLRIELVSDLQGGRLNSLDEFIPTIEDIPGFVIEGGERKFVTFYDGANGTLVVIVGPPLGNGFYYHRQLLEPIKKAGAINAAWADQFISGGGEVKFTKNPDSPWVLEFGGRSGDFGVFNPRLLLHRDTIQDMLGTPDRKVKVSFNWKD